MAGLTERIKVGYVGCEEALGRGILKDILQLSPSIGYTSSFQNIIFRKLNILKLQFQPCIQRRIRQHRYQNERSIIPVLAKSRWNQVYK